MLKSSKSKSEGQNVPKWT